MPDIIGDIGQAVPGVVQSLHNNIMKTLHKHYPVYYGYWRVRVDTHNGVVWIWNEKLTGEMSFMLHIVNIDPEGRAVKKAGGEFLERYRAARKRGISIREATRDVRMTNLGEGIYET